MKPRQSVASGLVMDLTDSGQASGACALTRRASLALGSALLLKMTNARSAQLAVVDKNMTPLEAPAGLIVGGPENGPLSGWAHFLGTAIGQHVGGPDDSLRISFVGGMDGVTASNQFEARTVPDGSTALLVSGSSAIAWLTGDQRAHFDAGRWLPVATGLASGIVLRAPSLSAATLPNTAHRPLRLATSGPADLAVAATLGLSMLGIETRRTDDADPPLTTLRKGRADWVFLHGPDSLDLTAAARTLGAVPMFSLGMMDDAGKLGRDPHHPGIPTLPELLATGRHLPHSVGLLKAWHAVAASAQIEFALILPWLTPASTVSQWRKAVSQISPTIRSDAPADAMLRQTQFAQIRLKTDPAANFGLSAIAVDANTLLELRSWAASRQP